MSAFGIYVHWPYCAAICPYCDFNVYRARRGAVAPLIDAIIADMEGHAQRIGRREAVSLFFGGGTPSLLGGDEIARLIEAASRTFTLAADCEITLEANPEDHLLFADHAAAGVNRFSIGAQALSDAALKSLGRVHDAATVKFAVAAAARTRQRVSLDLIYAREGQGVDEWRIELREALALPIEHASLYQLTIEPDTAFARRVKRGRLAPPDDDLAAALFEATQDVSELAGFPAYEISNHARKPSARARHNLLYWRGEDWIGVGPGAHGRITHDGSRIATESQRRPADYMDAVSEHGVGWIVEAALDPDEIADEILLMGLRIVEGADVRRIESLRTRPLNAAAMKWLSEQGFITVDKERLCLTAAGRVVANRVAAELMSEQLEDKRAQT